MHKNPFKPSLLGYASLTQPTVLEKLIHESRVGWVSASVTQQIEKS
jgi:hypothetical protein